MLETPQMCPFKTLVSISSRRYCIHHSPCLSFTRRHHTETIEGASTPRKRASLGRESNSPSNNRVELIDSDNDGIPDFIELRSFQDRDSFRLWFTAIAETQFYQLSDQWNAEQRIVPD